MLEEVEKIEVPLKVHHIPILIPDISGWLAKSAPEEYKAAFGHFVDAKVSFYKAISSFIETRIKELQKSKEELGKPKREKVKVE